MFEPTTSREFYQTAARYYDAENAAMTDDLHFYSALMAEYGGPVLDVGCGTGRVTLHLAQEGARVVGVDYSPVMLARAGRKLDVLPDLRAQVTLIQGDAVDLSLTEQFRLILVTYNSFMHLYTPERQLAMLERLRARLLPGGVIAIDLPNPSDLFATADTGALVLERTFVEPESGHVVMQQSVSALDRAEQMMSVTWIYDELAEDGTVRRLVAPMRLRYVFPAEMDLLLRLAGLERAARYGDYDFSPFTDGTPRMIVLAQEAKR
jgi:SAM-dependent methyltransferase